MTNLSVRHVIDLTTVGNAVDIDVAGVTALSLHATDGLTWGSGVVSVRKVIGGEAVAYDPAKSLSNASQTIESLPVFDAMFLRLQVTTAGTGHGRIAVAAKAETTVVEAL